jgi:hypothetical protein
VPLRHRLPNEVPSLAALVKVLLTSSLLVDDRPQVRSGVWRMVVVLLRHLPTSFFLVLMVTIDLVRHGLFEVLMALVSWLLPTIGVISVRGHFLNGSLAT